MEDYYGLSRGHVPAFGSWDCADNLPFTQCFETARRHGSDGGGNHGLLRYSYSEDRDLYVAGDLYDNSVVTPTMIVVPRRRNRARYPHVSKGSGDQKEKKGSWGACEGGKEPPSPPPRMTSRTVPKPVDEDLYKISPDLLQTKPRKKRPSFIASCLMPICDA